MRICENYNKKELDKWLNKSSYDINYSPLKKEYTIIKVIHTMIEYIDEAIVTDERLEEIEEYIDRVNTEKNVFEDVGWASAVQIDRKLLEERYKIKPSAPKRDILIELAKHKLNKKFHDKFKKIFDNKYHEEDIILKKKTRGRHKKTFDRMIIGDRL